MTIVKNALKPLESFLKLEAASGIILFMAAAFAFFLANSIFATHYFHIINLPITFAAGEAMISKPLVFWINDALMVLFFFVVGLEIKRELVAGELNTPTKAAFPTLAAIGGAIVPALFYYSMNSHDHELSSGWGIPMATDIAFAVGVMTLFGKRVPAALKIFLLALAIVDDLIAVLVIAIFYTAQINYAALAAAGAVFLITNEFKRAGVKNYVFYFLLGIGAWVAVFASGVHATIAGCALGLLTPVHLPDGEKPAEELVHFLHPWVAFIVMPVFAFFNSGVRVNIESLEASFSHPITLGVILGLVIGKPIGITAATWIGSKLGIVRLPSGITIQHVLAVGFLGGIGFTMSLFVAGLSFNSEILLDQAKIGVLVASFLAAIIGSLYLSFSIKHKVP